MRKEGNTDAAYRVADEAFHLAQLQRELSASGFTILADHVGLALRELRTAEVSGILNDLGVPFDAARP